MTTTTSVLVVEDEDSFIDALTVGLTREGEGSTFTLVLPMPRITS